MYTKIMKKTFHICTFTSACSEDGIVKSLGVLNLGKLNMLFSEYGDIWVDVIEAKDIGLRNVFKSESFLLWDRCVESKSTKKYTHLKIMQYLFIKLVLLNTIYILITNSFLFSNVSVSVNKIRF